MVGTTARLQGNLNLCVGFNHQVTNHLPEVGSPHPETTETWSTEQRAV